VERLVFAGGYTQDTLMGDGSILKARGRGIATYALSEGRLVLRSVVDSPNPTYLAVHPGGKSLYATHELMDYMGLASAAVSAYRIGEDGALTLISRQPTLGGAACHLSLGPDGRHLIVSNYMGGSVCVFPVGEDLGVEPLSCFFQHTGAGLDAVRQGGPHVHQAIPDRLGRHVLVADLGADEILVYGADWQKGHLIPGTSPLRVPAGQGPRQCVFNEAGDRLYALTEMGSSICVFSYDAETGAGALMETQSMLPEGYIGDSSAACVRLHPNGKLLFASNRGHDSIAGFRVVEDGRLRPIGITPTGGRIPRDFALTLEGDLLIVGNQESDELVVFRVDAENCALTEVSRASCPSVTTVAVL
jgi:6-phosphogluconolactonase